MNILKPKYEILTDISEGGIEELKHIEFIGRQCYKSEDRITDDCESAKKFVKMLINNGHEAMIEHGPSLSVLFTVDRGVTHETVRHRTCSFAQESTRYVNYASGKYGSEINVIDIEGGIKLDRKMRNLNSDVIVLILDEWLRAMEDAEYHYMRMIDLGATPQIARGVLPTSTKADIVITTNYREWRHIFNLRTPITAHPQIREIMIPLLADLKTKIPVIFDDIDLDIEDLMRATDKEIYEFEMEQNLKR